MRVFCYDDTGGHYEISEEEIIKKYYPFWAYKMRKVGKEKFINHENCIEDFCVIKWAWEKE